MGSQFFSLIFIQFVQVNGLLELDDDSGFPNPGQMVLEYGGRVENHHGDYGHAAFFRNLEAALVERKECVIYPVAGSLRENAEGGAAFDLFHAFQDCLQPFLDIVPVKEEAVDCLHPVLQQYPPEHLFLRHIPGDAGKMGIGEHDIEIAAVVAHVEDGAVGGDIFRTPDNQLRAGEKGDAAESPAYDCLCRPVFAAGIGLSDEPQHQQRRYAKHQKQD